jgi:deoxycytidylate deaminase
LHAECAALLKADIRGDTVVVFRIKKDGFGCSKPCERCQRFIRDNKIEKVIYTNDNGILETMYL